MTIPFPGDGSNCHFFLATGSSPAQARQQVLHFMNTTLLIAYQSTTINDEEIRPGMSAEFWSGIEAGITANRAFCKSLMIELEETGLSRMEDLLAIPHGYPSKLLHILTHMLDGFIGIDSVFYNLAEDSHWLSAPLRAAIHDNPENYWLVPLRHGPVARSLLKMERL
jgi:hypothetical protein